MVMNEKDSEILSILRENAVTPKAEIARRVGLAPSVVADRIRRLEESGVIKGYETRLDPKAMGLPLLTFIFVSELKPNGGFDTGGALAKVEGVEEVHKIAGDDCFLLKLRAAGTEELSAILDDQINAIPTVSGVRTSIVLKSIAEGSTNSLSP